MPAAALTKKWRDDMRCGIEYPLPDGNVTECNPVGQSPCCGVDGWCGSTTRYCSCEGCVDYRDIDQWRANGKYSLSVSDFRTEKYFAVFRIFIA